MATREFNFDANARSASRTKGNIFIGDKTFHPRKRTQRLMAEWADVMPDQRERQLQEKAEAGDDAAGKEVMKQGATLVARQLAILMVDDEGNPPDAAFLAEELDIEDAGELLNMLSPREEAEAGNA